MEVFHSTVVEDRLLQTLLPVALVTTPAPSCLQAVLHCDQVLPGLALAAAVIQGAEGGQRSAGSGVAASS